jgi:hypothetical protein
VYQTSLHDGFYPNTRLREGLHESRRIHLPKALYDPENHIAAHTKWLAEKSNNLTTVLVFVVILPSANHYLAAHSHNKNNPPASHLGQSHTQQCSFIWLCHALFITGHKLTLRQPATGQKGLFLTDEGLIFGKGGQQRISPK